jgi:adenosylhomocysteine nucleosidase
MEWKFVTSRYPGMAERGTPYGEYILPGGSLSSVVLFHGGWGKIAAAGSTQYAITRWKPELLVNLGTCGGFEGEVAKGDVLLVNRTVVYDIVEQMGDPAEAIRDYSTDIDLSWLGPDRPKGVRESLLVSGDRDIVASEIPMLRKTYGAVAADWESGAIAYVAKANRVPTLILRGVSDVTGVGGDETYGNEAAFEAGARLIMSRLLDDLPEWVGRFRASRARVTGRARPAS